MGGGLTIESIETGGIKVSFTVLAPACPPQADSQMGQIPFLPMNLKILLAEDDDDVANLVTILLSEQGITVVRAENGALAIEQLKAQSFDLVLMDLHMPVMDGHTAVTNIRDSGDATPVIIMTASAGDADRIRADQLSCDGYLVKPVDLTGLMELFAGVLNSDNIKSTR
jgi:CheY-like chemotaxis protein